MTSSASNSFFKHKWQINNFTWIFSKDACQANQWAGKTFAGFS